MSIVKLVTLEGETVEVEQETIMKSKLVKGIIEDSGIEDDIPLPQIKKTILDKVIVFLVYIKTTPPPELEKPLKSTDMVVNAGEWFANFVDVQEEELYDMILAANFMDIKPLLELCCAKL